MISHVVALFAWIAFIGRHLVAPLEKWLVTFARKRPAARVIALAASGLSSVVFLALGRLHAAVVFAYVLLGVGLISEYTGVCNRRENICRKLRDFSKRVETKHDYGKYIVLYEVDPSPGGLADSWTRRFEVVAQGNSAVVLVRRFFVGRTRPVSGIGLRFEDLRVDAEAGTPGAESEPPDVYVFGAESQDRRGRLEAELLFAPPIVGSRKPVLVSVFGRYPGTWSSLRKTGRDEGSFYLGEKADSLELSVKLPRKWKDRRLELRPRGYLPPGADPEAEQLAPPKNGTVKQERRLRGEPQFTWEIPKAKPGTYYYEVVAEKTREVPP